MDRHRHKGMDRHLATHIHMDRMVGVGTDIGRWIVVCINVDIMILMCKVIEMWACIGVGMYTDTLSTHRHRHSVWYAVHYCAMSYCTILQYTLP